MVSGPRRASVPVQPGLKDEQLHLTLYCEDGCEIRKCGAEKAMTTCAECADYRRDKLAGFQANVPDAKANLEVHRLA